MENFWSEIEDFFLSEGLLSRSFHTPDLGSGSGKTMDLGRMGDKELLKSIAYRARQKTIEEDLSIPADEFFIEVGKIFASVRRKYPLNEPKK